MYDQYSAHLPNRWPDVDLSTRVIGYFAGTGRFDFRQIPRDVSLHVVAEGNGIVEVEGLRAPAQADDIFVFWPGRAAHYYESPTSPWRYHWMTLGGAQVVSILASIGIHPNQVVYPQAGARLKTYLESQRALLAGDDWPDVLPMTTAWEAIETLRPMTPLETDERHVDIAAICRQYIDTHFMNPITVYQMAQHCGVDRTTLFRHYQRAYGCSPKQHMQARRLEHARALLKEPRSVTNVAEACGFANPAYFARVFRQVYGVAPTEWRISNGENIQ